MAEHKVSGDDQFLFLGIDGLTYSQVICLTGTSYTRATNVIDAKTKCGPDKLPGTQDVNVTFEGQSMYDPAAGKTSTDEMDDWWKNKTTVYWKIGKLVPAQGDITYTGTGFISQLDEAFAQDTPSTFAGAIGVYGLPSKSTATS